MGEPNKKEQQIASSKGGFAFPLEFGGRRGVGRFYGLCQFVD